MANYLITFTDTTDDDFDVHGFKIMTPKQVTNFEYLANEITWEFQHVIGNKVFTYSNGEDFLTRIEFKEITNDQYFMLDRMFDGEFGTFIGLSELQNIFDGDKDDEDDIEDED